MWRQRYMEWEKKGLVLCMCSKCDVGNALCGRANTTSQRTAQRHTQGMPEDLPKYVKPDDLLKQLQKKYGPVQVHDDVPPPGADDHSGSSQVNDDEPGEVPLNGLDDHEFPELDDDEFPAAAAPLGMQFPPKPTVYNKHGTISFFADRGQALKDALSPTDIPSESSLRSRLPAGLADGCVAIIPLDKCLDVTEDEDLRQVAELVCKLLADKARWSLPQDQYSSLLETLCNLPGVVQPKAKALLEEHCKTYYKAKKFLEKLGYGVKLYVYHVCSNVRCCHIYRNESKDLVTCPCHGCGEARYKDAEQRVPVRKMFYLSLQDWIVNLHAANDLQPLLRWHKEERKPVDGVESDVYDTPLWKLFTDDAQIRSSGK